jgi:hypothetical protein
MDLKPLIYVLCLSLAARYVLADDESTGKSSKVTNLIVRVEHTRLLLFWDGVIENPLPEIEIYRTTDRITDSGEVSGIKPYAILTNAYYLEDTLIDSGIPYFYLILMDNNNIIIPGKNGNIIPFFFGCTDTNINAETEIFSTGRETYGEFMKKFEK